MVKTIALIMAGGIGKRFDASLPKQYLELGNKSILSHTMEAFCKHPDIDQVTCVIHPDAELLYEQYKFEHHKVSHPVYGGDKRQDSVRNGLEAIQEEAPEYVLIHDAARPFVTNDIITASVESLKTHNASVPVYAIPDTIKRVEDGLLAASVDRANIHIIQTPQNFHYDLIFQAHQEKKNVPVTDDTSLFQEMGLPVAAIPGDRDNIKITRKSDLDLAHHILKGRQK